MIYDLSLEVDRHKFKERANSVVTNKEKVELTIKKGQRTISQNKYLHLVLGWFSTQYGCSIDETKVKVFKTIVNKDLFVRDGVNNKGQAIQFLRSSSELNVDEMGIAIERFRNWSADKAGIYIPESSDKSFAFEAEKQIKNNRQFM